MSVMKAEQNKFQQEHKGIYGKISKYAASDTMLSCDAKALYGLLCTYAIYGGAITAGNRMLCRDLNIGAKKLYGLLFELSSQNYLEIIKGRFAKNNYKIAVCPEKYWRSPADKKDIYAYEQIRAGGIQSYGYGLTEQRVLRDPELPVTAKGIYNYFCAFAGNASTAYPLVETILRDLRICESTYYKYIKQLVEKCYVQVIEHKTSGGKYSRNEYKLIGHPNAHKPSNYQKNIAEKQSPPSSKSDTRGKNKKDSESNAKPDGSQSSGAQSFREEPCFTEPSSKKPYPENDTTYKKNTVNNNSQKKNNINQAGKNFEKKFKPSSEINQSKKSTESDSIDKNNFKNISVNPDKIYQDLQKHKGIPASYLKSKANIAYIIKTLSGNANSPEPENNKLRRLLLNCLVNMLYDSGNPYRKYNPEKVAGFVNAHIKINNGVVSFDNWLEQFEKSFMQSVRKPEVANKIKNPYAYVKTSLWKFLSTYSDFYYDFKAGYETGRRSFDSSLFEEKLAKSAAKLLD